MLVLKSGKLVDDHFKNLPDYLRAGDLLVLNDSRVLPARLYATRAGLSTQPSSPLPSGIVEVLLTKHLALDYWSALVRPGRKVPVGETLLFANEAGAVQLTAQVTGVADFGERTLRFASDPDFYTKLDAIGHMPLPPYIHRKDSAGDRTRYQTIYAREHGSAAAPTAGLHFTPEILQTIRKKGVEVVNITLHVGLGTFQPVRVERVDDIRLHTERYTLPPGTADALNRAQSEGRRVISAGTTTTRTLEHCASLGDKFQAHSGETSIFIAPGYRFKVVSGLLTNFHLPKSTLLMLVSALGGVEEVREAYRHAVAEGYRFFSYGDCMLLA